MTTKISVSLSAIDDDFLRQLKGKYSGHTRLDIQVVEMDEEPTLTEADFWNIIDALDWDAPNTDAILEPAIQALSQHPLSHIYQFEDMMAEKLLSKLKMNTWPLLKKNMKALVHIPRKSYETYSNEAGLGN